MIKKSVRRLQTLLEAKLGAENEELRAHLDEAEEALRAIRSGDWDALIVLGVGGEQILTLKHSELRYRRLFEAAQDGILILDAETGRIEDVNPSLIDMLGYSREEFAEKKLWQVGAFKDVEASRETFEALQQNKYIRYENLSLRAKNGRLTQVEFVSNGYLVDNKKVIQCNIRDITSRKQTEAALRESAILLHEQSMRDYLTGVFNRRYLEATLERELLRASRKKLPLGIIMFDVDKFKIFNDTYGHAAGDVVLQALGNLLLRFVRGEDIPARYGGDEFIIILPDASLEVTLKRAELLREKVRDFHISFEGHLLGAITLKLGFATYPDDGTTSAAILKAADDALYRAKRAGDSQIVSYA